MIERYTLPEIGNIWTDGNRFRIWLDVELAVCRAQAKLGNIPEADLKIIEEKANFDLKRVLEIENEVHHDVIAFLTSVAEFVGPESRYIHMGMTSSDLLDTTIAIQLKQAGELILEKLREFKDSIGEQAVKYKKTVMMGRSHGMHAEPITFGLKMALWYEEIKRGIIRLEHALEMISVCKISGVVGTYAYINPDIEVMVAKDLNLKPAPISTQIIQRDRHAEFLSALALIGSSMEKFSTEIRHLQRTEVFEALEPFGKKQKGSSAMPHKRNPILCERISGMARLLRGNALAGMENISLWHERDISHSSVERVIFPDSTAIVYYMTVKFINIIKNIEVHPENMQININRSFGLIHSQDMLLRLVDKGLTREKSYGIVQRLAMRAWHEKTDFKQLLFDDKETREHLSKEEIEGTFVNPRFINNVERIFERLGLN